MLRLLRCTRNDRTTPVIARNVVPKQSPKWEWRRLLRCARKVAGLARVLALAALLLSGCVRGIPSSRPPIHVNPNMDHQPKFKAQSANSFFADGAAMRVPPAGTIARGQLREDDLFWRGVDPTTGKALAKSPIAVTLAGLRRGQERFNIYCAVCHGRAGDGQGIMLKKGYVPTPSFHSDLIRGYPDGQIFQTISNGVRNMPAYRGQIPVEDRWLIVHYLRALQRSQQATLTDVPPEERGRLQQ